MHGITALALVTLCQGFQVILHSTKSSFVTKHGTDNIHGHMTNLSTAQVVKENQSFQRAVVSRDEALGMFQENKFKVEIIGNLPQSAVVSLYR